MLDAEVDQIIEMGLKTKFNSEITSLKDFLKEDFDAVFVGTGAPKGKDLNIEGRKEAEKNIHIGIDFLTSISL